MSDLHSLLTANHKIENWTFANMAARTAAGVYVPVNDIGKIAYQSDEGSYWRLTLITIVGGGPTYTPTWAGLGGQGANPNRVENGYLLTSLSGVESTSLTNKDITGLPFGYKLILTIADSDGFYTFQNGAPNAVLGDIPVASNAGYRWRKTGGY